MTKFHAEFPVSKLEGVKGCKNIINDDCDDDVYNNGDNRN